MHNNDKEKTAEKQKVLIAGLREYFFLLLFSVLEVGPQVKKMMGFDLIVTPDCIEFSMELC